jgi:hypothetical protein
MRRNRYMGRIRHRRAVSYSEAAPAGVMGLSASVQVVVKPVSQTRCQPGDNSEQKNSREEGILSC